MNATANAPNIAVILTGEFEQSLREFKEEHAPVLEKAMADSAIHSLHKEGFDRLESGELRLFDLEQLPASGTGDIVLRGVFSGDYLEFLAAVRASVVEPH